MCVLGFSHSAAAFAVLVHSCCSLVEVLNSAAHRVACTAQL